MGLQSALSQQILRIQHLGHRQTMTKSLIQRSQNCKKTKIKGPEKLV